MASASLKQPVHDCSELHDSWRAARSGYGRVALYYKNGELDTHSSIISSIYVEVREVASWHVLAAKVWSRGKSRDAPMDGVP